MRPKILRTDPELDILGPYMDRIRPLAEVIDSPTSAAADILALARQHDPTMILTCYDPVGAEVIAAAPSLKAVIKYGVGVNNIDLEAATAARVLVANAPDYGTGTVADHAFLLMMAACRRLSEQDRVMRADGWAWPQPTWLASDVCGKTIGLLGLGRIGRAMAKRTLGFDMTRLAYDPYVDRSLADGLDVAFVPFEELFERADILSVHCFLTDETRGLVGSGELARMRPGSYLINVSRAEVVDRQALLSALQSGHLAGAGLDVFWDEPLAADDPFLALPNVIATPHFAWYTREAFQRCEDHTFDAVMAVLGGRQPKTPRNPEVLALLPPGKLKVT